MGRAGGRGGKNRRRAKNVSVPTARAEWKRENEEYAEVITMLGDRRCECKCTDGKTRTGTICGSMRKRVWVRVGDLVCVSLRGYQDDKCDITYKYTPDEVEILKRDGSLAMLTPPPTGEATVSMSIPIPTETDPDVDMLDFSTI